MNKFAFVSDMFVEQYRGGAELTTEAIIGASTAGNQIAKLLCSQVTHEILEANKDIHYIICNFASLKDELKIHMCKNNSYSIVEYDYKFCEYRSLEKHTAATDAPCDCVKKISGKINSAFYGYASKVWFMSEGQKNIFLSNVGVLKEENCEVLSSIFSPGDLRFMDSIKDNEKDNTYLILGSPSWIKGTNQCINYAKERGLPYEVIQGIPYHELLIKISSSKGLIFLPLGSDTCPRLAIEARLLGCDLILNNHVQHKDEEWFQTQESSYTYLRDRPAVFWDYYKNEK